MSTNKDSLRLINTFKSEAIKICGEIGNCCCGPGPSCYYKEEFPSNLSNFLQIVKHIESNSNNRDGEETSPISRVRLKAGENILVLGSGRGFDVFLSAHLIGSGGRVIGIDMNTKLIEKARFNAKIIGQSNVEFRLGIFENLPIAGGEIDAIISACIINLSTDRQRVFSEAFRVLKPGGRLALSDIIISEYSDHLSDKSSEFFPSGGILKQDIIYLLETTGFNKIEIHNKLNSHKIMGDLMPGRTNGGQYSGVVILASKPETDS